MGMNHYNDGCHVKRLKSHMLYMLINGLIYQSRFLISLVSKVMLEIIMT